MPPSRNDSRNDNEPVSPSRNDIRNDNTTARAATCPVCGTVFTPIRRQRYCAPACRQAAWRARRPDPAPQPSIVVGPRTTRRDNTVYQCLACDSRYLGRQWCRDCNKPCTRLDTGGLCPIATSQSRSKTSPTNTHPDRQRPDQHRPGRPATRPLGGQPHTTAGRTSSGHQLINLPGIRRRNHPHTNSSPKPSLVFRTYAAAAAQARA